MANERNPDDFYRSADDPYRTKRADPDEELRRAARVDNDLQMDPELAEGPASGGRIALFAIAIAIVLGAVFYGLNNSSTDQAGTSPASSTAQNAPSSPRANTDPGVTTGAAPARPQMPPSSAPTGPDLNRSGNPPVDSAPAK